MGMMALDSRLHKLMVVADVVLYFGLVAVFSSFFLLAGWAYEMFKRRALQNSGTIILL